MADFDLYTWDRHNALAPVVFFEEIKASYHLIPTNPTSKILKKEIKKVSPLGEIPVLIDQRSGKRKPSLFGTGAILFYLALDTREFLPAAPKLYTETIRWFFWQERAIHGNIIIYENTKEAAVRAECRAQIRRYLKRLDTLLKNKEYLAEEFSIADMALFFLIRRPEQYDIWISDLSNLRNWVERINKRKSFRDVLGLHFY